MKVKVYKLAAESFNWAEIIVLNFLMALMLCVRSDVYFKIGY